jgi:hypothetical protein
MRWHFKILTGCETAPYSKRTPTQMAGTPKRMCSFLQFDRLVCRHRPSFKKTAVILDLCYRHESYSFLTFSRICGGSFSIVGEIRAAAGIRSGAMTADSKRLVFAHTFVGDPLGRTAPARNAPA